jgi:Family of unknown function (DUF6982)
LAGSTSKKVVAVRFDRAPVAGFVNPATFLGAAGVEVLTTGGSVITLPYVDLKVLSFVRDFDKEADWRGNRFFAARPKMAGLWVRLSFRDGDSIEGVIPNNLLLIDPRGVTIAPPDAGFLNQRLFIPRDALTQMQVLGVIGSPLRRRPAKPLPKEQLDMFE